jgi:hypothetical protein
VADSLDWGNIKERAEISYGRYVVDLGGCKLFTIRNGNVDFPATDYSVMVLHGLSAIGYLNFNPIDYAVIFDDSRPLISKDGHKFRAMIDVQIQITDVLHTTWRNAVRQRNGLEAKTRTVIETAATELFKEHEFKDIRITAPEVLSALKNRVADILPKETPYQIASLGYSAEAVDDAVEAGFIAAIRAATLAKEDQIHQKLEQEKAEREHAAKLKDQEKRQTLDADQAGYDRIKMAADAEADHKLQEKAFEAEQKQQLAIIELDKKRAEAATIAFGNQAAAEAAAMKAMSDAAGGDPLKMLIFKAPDLAAGVLSTQIQQQGQIERGKITADKNLAKAEGVALGLTSAIGVRVPQMNLTVDMPKGGTSAPDKSSDDADEP